MSRASAQHRKPSRSSSPRPSQPARPSQHSRPRQAVRSIAARHRKPSPIASVLQHTPTRLAAAVAGSALIVGGAWQAAPSWLEITHHPAATGKADAPTATGTGASLSQLAGDVPKTRPSTVGLSGLRAAHASGSSAVSEVQRRKQPHAPQPPASAAAPGYLNPLRAVGGLIPERIDEGVDFGGSGPIYAIGDAVVTNATGANSGWPGGGWITYQLTDGQDAGLMVYVAEDVTPTVQVGEHVSSSTVIANMYNGGDGIETGWAMADGASAESELPEAGGIGGGGPFPTMIGLSFEGLLQSLGVPAANNRSDLASGILPANYPAG